MIAGSGGFQVIDGSGYIRQRIALALGEPYGDDPFQPQWGSTLESYIGTPIDDGTPALISSEVARVMDMLIAMQHQQIISWSAGGARSQMNAADVIARVDSVDAAVGPDPEVIQVSIALTTGAGTALTVTRTLTPS